MCKTNTRKRVALLVAVLLAVAIFVTPVSAYTGPYQLLVFTDKKVYLDKPTDHTAESTWVENPNMVVKIYAVLLDSDGNMVRSGASFSGYIKTYKYQDHGTDTGVHHVSESLIDGTYFNNTISSGSFTLKDGIYMATVDPPDIETFTSPALPNWGVHVIENITISETTLSGLTQTVQISTSRTPCGHGNKNLGSTGLKQAHAQSQHDGVPCTLCHWGMGDSNGEHVATLGVHGNNTALGDDPNLNQPTDADATWAYNTGRLESGYTETWKNAGRADLCIACHNGGGAIANVFDMWSTTVPAGDGDLNDDTIQDNDRPSCSIYQGFPGTGTTFPACHAATPSSSPNGSTNIEQTSLKNIDFRWKQEGAMNSTAHNHTGNKANVSCEICHGQHPGQYLPNSTTTDYSNINTQCWKCHNISGGLNITSNGGTNVAHDGKTNCKNCHTENNKLDTHLVPTGVFGGRWCLDCHNLTGKAPTNMKVDSDIVNTSNLNYTHYKLNKNSDATNSSRICWGCHTNNSYVINGRVNSTSLPASDHPTGYDTPRNCTLCHYNTSAYNFSAPQNARHTWYATNMKTPGVTDCTDCHAQNEMLNTWNQSVYPPKNNSEAASHYGKNRTSFFQNLITTGEYCSYCHQNESTVMGPFANPDNEVRSDHASNISTPSCGNNTCHKPGRIHDDTLVVPAYNESNINTTCQACHSNTSYNAHNSTLTCWDCHMGNVSNTSATWIHPIQFIQYNGNFTGAKLTGATCYDCHKSTSVDNTTLNLSGKKAPKVYNQAHSNDPSNGTKWGDYWKYTPTTYEFASYYVGSGDINPAYPFDNIRVPSNDYMELIENQTGSANDPATFPYTEKEQQIEGPPVPNWTSSTAITSGTPTITATQDGTVGNPAGSLKASLKATGASSGTVSWNYSFYYKPDTYDYASTNISVDYKITVESGLTQNVYLRLVKPSGAIATLASASSSSTTGWLTLTNNSFGLALDADGSVTPYKIQLYTEFSGTGSKQAPKTDTVNYDNILLRFQEKVWNKYDIVINTTGVPVNGSSKLGMSYQVHKENTSLRIYNKTSQAYELLDTLDKGVFFDYVKDINSTHHVNSTNGITGNVSVRFVDTDQSDTDAVSDKFHIRYLYVYTDRGLQYPCEQCHSPNKHYVNPAIGSPDKFNASNKYNNTDLKNSTWCQQCHWQGAANYSKMIQEYNKTRNPPENIPPEITGNKTYGNFTTSKDGKTSYVNHTGSGFADMSDLGCFSCHGKTGDTTTSQFIHNVQAGSSGGRNCTACHNIGGSKNNINFTAVNMSMHGKLNSGASSTPQNASSKPCWGCHGTKNGTYANESDQPENDHNGTYYKNPRKCYDCHITNSTQFTTKNVTDHIPSGYANAGTDVNTSSYNNTYCSYCHNNSVNNGYEPDAMGVAGGNPMNASVSHYGANKTANKLMAAANNSTDCVYCHRNSSNMLKWGIQPGSTANISKKSSHDSATSSSSCSSCHGNYAVTSSFTFHNGALGPGGGSGPDCIGCHDAGKSPPNAGALVNSTAMNDTNAIHRNLNSGASTLLNAENKKCWACHDEGSEPTAHNNSRYKNPYTCTDCHNASGSQSGKYPGWNVTEHVKAGTVSGTEIFTPQAGTCYDCHNRSEMMVGNYDPDGASNNVYSGANGGNNSTSHYGKKRSDLGSSDAYCNYCHNNASSPFYLSNSNKSIIEHTTNTTANISNATALECSDCHSTGRIHNDTLAKPVVQVWTSGRQDYCAPCHRAGNASATKYVYGHNSSNISAITTDCGYCHNASSQGQVSTGKLRIHTFSLTNKSTANTTCASCHQDSNYVTSQRVIYTHYPGASQGKANTSLDSFTCEACHGSIASNKMHLPVTIPSDRCNNCHNGTVSGSYKATKIPYVNTTKHNNASHNVSNNINCDWCHNNSNSIQKFHFTQYPNGSVQVPGWAGWSNGTNANCTDCHDTYKEAKPFYAEPIWHKGNYGSALDNCYQCHTNVSSNTSSYAPVALHNVTKAIDWSYCNNCHSNNYGGAPVVDNASLASSMHFNLNGSTPSNTEPACKACHGGNSTVHKNASVNNCTYCHITGNTKFGAKNVSRHIPYPYTIDVNTSRYQQVFCSNCHNNSLGTFNDPSPGNSNATTSHYGMNKTGGKLMYNTSGNSEDCAYCHRNNSNMAAWGILNTSNANLSKKGANHATAANSDCYTCHVNSTTTPLTFHVEEINTGAGGGPDCKACHDIGGNAQGKLVNFSAMNTTGAIHKNLNKDRTPDTTSSAENRKCWACHTRNGTQPQAGNHTLVDKYKNPYNCTDCHITKAGQNFNYTPSLVLNVTQHKADTVNGTTIFTPSAADCYSCHNKTEMMINAYDPDAGTGAVYGGLHGGDDSVSHYGLARSLGAGDAYCNYCHSNTTSVFPFLSDHNKSIIEHTTNPAANISNSTTLECADCHKSGRIHEASLNKTPQSAWTSGQKDFCAPCHKPKPAGSANKSVYQQGHDPVYSSGDRIGDCGYCHNASSQGINGSSLNVHSATLTNRSTVTESSTCKGCHNGTATYVGAAEQIFSHMPNAPQYRGNTSTSGYTCEYCHNMSGKPSMHSTGMTRSNGTCETCHLNSTSPYNSSRKNLTQMIGMLNHSYNGSANTTCKMCHNASGRAKFHLSKYAYGDVADPQNSSGYSTFEPRGALLVNCRDCHETYNDTEPFNAPYFEANKTGVNLQEHKGKGYTLNNCYVCHTYEDNVSKTVTVHNVSIEPLNGGPNCKKCHDIASPNKTSDSKMWVNFTAFNDTNSKHKNLTNATAWNGSTLFTLIDTACWACHQSDGKQMERHPDLKDNTTSTGGYRAYRCADCHTVGGIVSGKQPKIYQNATKVYKHYPGAVFSGSKAFTSAVNCSICHKNSKIEDINISAYSDNIDAVATNVSHYATRIDLIDTRNNTDSFGCNQCHAVGESDGTYGLAYGNAGAILDNHNRMGSSPARCQKSCHNSNPDVNITLHNSTMGIYIGTSGCYSSGCHTLPSTGGRKRR